MAIGFNSNVTGIAKYSAAKATDYKKQKATDGRENQTSQIDKSFDTGVVYERSVDAVGYSVNGGSNNSSGYGRTIGEPKLSKEASEYYDKLKSKYGNMDFILVSKDMKETAKSQAASFANPNKMVVLIDEEKIERMATDENYRKQYEGLIAMAKNNLPQLKNAFADSKDVKGYGMQVNDNGTATLFAVVKKSGDAQAERIKKAAEHKKAEKKEEAKKAEKKEKEKKLEEKKAEKAEKEEKLQDLFGYSEDDDYEIITASSMEELLSTVSQYTGETYNPNSTTASYSGGSIDYQA